MKCEYCSKEHDGSYGSGRFCNIKCSRGFSSKEKRQEINRKVKLKLIGRPSPLKGRKITSNKLSKEVYKRISESLKLRAKINRNLSSFDKLSLYWKKHKLLDECGHKCQICNQGEIWNSAKLVLQLDHIDGNNKNNSKLNLRILCPNCHTQTDTYCKLNHQEKEKQRNGLIDWHKNRDVA